MLHTLEPISKSEKTESSEITLVLGRGRELVRGKLFQDKNVVGFVVIEAANHVIAISPRERIIGIFPVAANLAFGVAIARGVEPVPAPPLAIMRRPEKAIDDLLEGVRGIVFEKI